MTPAERLQDFRKYLDTLEPHPAVHFAWVATTVAEWVARRRLK